LLAPATTIVSALIESGARVHIKKETKKKINENYNKITKLKVQVNNRNNYK